MALIKYEHKVVDVKLEQSKPEHVKVKVIKDQEGRLVINFIKYGGDLGDGTCSYNIRNVKVVSDSPVHSGTAQGRINSDTLDYVYYKLGKDKTIREKMEDSAENYAITITLGRVFPLTGEGITTLNFLNDLINISLGKDEKTLTAAQKKLLLGQTANMFNLIYTPSWVEEDGKQKMGEYIGGFHVKYRVDDVNSESTAECVENFNKNLSKGGKYEEYANDIGYEENIPLTEEDVISEPDKIVSIINNWNNKAIKNNEDYDNLTKRLEAE